MARLPVDDEVKRLTKEGKNAPQIARALEIGLSTVKRRKRELGLLQQTGEGAIKRWVDQNPDVRRAFGSLSPRTRNQYYADFRVYANWCGKTPRELWDEPWETIRDRIMDFRAYLEEQGKSPNTLAGYTAAIRRFYEYNNIIFKGKFFTNGKGRQPLKENEKELITPQMLREILDVSTPIEKAMYMAQFQSGLGANELCSLRIGDVAEIKDGQMKLRIEDGVIKLKLKREKTNVKFTTFLGRDAIGYLEKWLELRQSSRVLLDRELSEGAKVKSKNDFLFVTYAKSVKEWGGVSPTTYAKYLRNRVRQLGWIDENMLAEGRLSAYRPHALRMSFSTICKHKAKIQWDSVEHMLGHKFGATDEAYIKFDEDDLKKAYKEAEPFLSLTPIEPMADDKYRELERKNELLRQRYEEQAKKISTLESKAADLAVLKEHLADAEVRDYLVELLAEKIVSKRKQQG